MNEPRQTRQLSIWIGVLGIVLLLVGTLIYAALESETRYRSDLANPVSGNPAIEIERQE
jgi:hypothetical protein